MQKIIPYQVDLILNFIRISNFLVLLRGNNQINAPIKFFNLTGIFLNAH